MVCYIRKYVIILGGGIFPLTSPNQNIGDVSPASPAGLTPVRASNAELAHYRQHALLTPTPFQGGKWERRKGRGEGKLVERRRRILKGMRARGRERRAGLGRERVTRGTEEKKVEGKWKEEDRRIQEGEGKEGGGIQSNPIQSNVNKRAPVSFTTSHSHTN